MSICNKKSCSKRTAFWIFEIILLLFFESNNLKSKLKSYATIKVGVKNYSKQLYLLEIANAVLNAKYGFSAFTIINE